MSLLRRFFPPVVRQHDRSDCGPAALLSVLRFHGGDVSLVRLRALARTDAKGTNLLSLLRAAEAVGFRARGATGSYDDLEKERMPCIAHVVVDDRLLHYVVVYEIDRRGVVLGDPARGRVRVSRGEFEAMWKSRAVLLLEPGNDLTNEVPPHWFRWILAHFKKEEAWLVQSVVLGAVQTVLGLATALFVQWIIDRFIPGRDYGGILVVGAALAVVQGLRAGTGYLRGRFAVELSRRVDLRVNEEFLQHLFHLPSSFFETRRTGDVTARLHDSVKIQRAVLTVFGTTVVDGLVIVGSLLFLFQFAPPLAWVAAAVLPVYAILVLFLTRRIAVEHRAVMKGYAGVESTWIDSLGGMEDIRGFGAADAFIRLNRAFYTRMQDAVVRLGFTEARAGSYAELAGGLLTIACLVYGALLVMGGQLLLGEMMAAYSLLTVLVPATNGLVAAHIALRGASVAADRLMDLLLTPVETGTGARPFRLGRGVDVRGARFSWPRGGPLLDGADLSIPVGRVTGLRGASGCGKSTLASILRRNHGLDEGVVLVDGVPADEIDLDDYRRNVALVPQQASIFSGTLADNILLGRSVADAGELVDRIAAAGLPGFPDRFDNGLMTFVGEDGRRLSSGERQMVGLLRALFDRPDLLILDEAVGAVDDGVAITVLEAVRRYARDHAVLLIAHDVRSLQAADAVFTLDRGRIAPCAVPRSGTPWVGIGPSVDAPQLHEREATGS